MDACIKKDSFNVISILNEAPIPPTDDQKRSKSPSTSNIKSSAPKTDEQKQYSLSPPPLLNTNKFTHPSKMYSLPSSSSTSLSYYKNTNIVPPILPLPFTDSNTNTLSLKTESSSYDIPLPLPPPPSISAQIPPPLVSNTNTNANSMMGPFPPPLMSSQFIDHHPPPPYPMFHMPSAMDNDLPPPVLPPHLMPHSIPPTIYGFPVQFNGHDFPLPPPPPPGMSVGGYGIPPTDPNGFLSIEYRCDFCGFVFNTKQKLSVHKKHMHGQQPMRKVKRSKVQGKGGVRYFCQYCKRGFSAKQHFDYHVRTHTGEKPFKCGQCGKAFRAKHSLKNHIRIHSGERPYQCKLCGKFFRQLGVMKNHIKTLHENTGNQ